MHCNCQDCDFDRSHGRNNTAALSAAVYTCMKVGFALSSGSSVAPWQTAGRIQSFAHGRSIPEQVVRHAVARVNLMPGRRWFVRCMAGSLLLDAAAVRLARVIRPGRVP
jgi:hypothetical protein